MVLMRCCMRVVKCVLLGPLSCEIRPSGCALMRFKQVVLKLDLMINHLRQILKGLLVVERGLLGENARLNFQLLAGWNVKNIWMVILPSPANLTRWLNWQRASRLDLCVINVIVRCSNINRRVFPRQLTQLVSLTLAAQNRGWLDLLLLHDFVPALTHNSLLTNLLLQRHIVWKCVMLTESRILVLLFCFFLSIGLPQLFLKLKKREFLLS